MSIFPYTVFLKCVVCLKTVEFIAHTINDHAEGITCSPECEKIRVNRQELNAQADREWAAALLVQNKRTLRDEFAIAAPPMPDQYLRDFHRKQPDRCWAQADAEWRYFHADAMLEARKQ